MIPSGITAKLFADALKVAPRASFAITPFSLPQSPISKRVMSPKEVARQKAARLKMMNVHRRMKSERNSPTAHELRHMRENKRLSSLHRL